MEIYYWTGFSKRKNSTKQPTSGTKVDVVLKVEGSIMSPSFELSGVPKSTTYFYCADFGRYYFVENVDILTNGVFRFNCSVDVMATYKSAIGSYTAFIERSASAGNSWLSDGQVIPTDEVVQCESTAGDTMTNLNILGTDFVVNVCGKNGVKNYILNRPTIQNAFSAFFDLTNYNFTQIQDCLKGLFNAIAQPAQYIRSIKWFPFTVNSSGSETAYFGYVATDAPVDVASYIADAGCTISQPSRYYNDWRDYDSRFTQVQIYLPGYGNVSIDPKYLTKTLAVSYNTDINTGECQIVLSAGSLIIATLSGCASIDVPMGGMTGTGQLMGILNMLGGMSANIESFVRSETKGFIGAAMAEFNATSSSTSSSGNERSWLNMPYVQMSITRLGSTSKATATHGTPDMENRTISSLSGYVRCSGASVSIDGFDSERDSINSYLNSGFYYE